MATTPRDPFDRARRRKNLIEMERRHIREGEARVARQEEVVCQLDSIGGHESEHALTARAVLVTFREFVTVAKQHLDDLGREHPDHDELRVRRSAWEA